VGHFQLDSPLTLLDDILVHGLYLSYQKLRAELRAAVISVSTFARVSLLTLDIPNEPTTVKRISGAPHLSRGLLNSFASFKACQYDSEL
jgi:hypothetical protein